MFYVCSLKQKWTTANLVKTEFIGMISGAYKIEEELRNWGRAGIQVAGISKDRVKAIKSNILSTFFFSFLTHHSA